MARRGALLGRQIQMLKPRGGSAPASTPLFKSGTFTGTGVKRDVSLPFVIPPDAFVFVWAADQALVWRHRTSWHGRSQQFNAVASSYVIGPSIATLRMEPVSESKFSVEAGYSVNAKTYYYLVFAANGSNIVETSSIVGNAIDPRTYDFTSRRPKLVMAKRDSTRSSVWAVDGGANPFRADIVGTTNAAVGTIAITATGVTLSSSVWVNENNNVALGEGIEYLSLIDGGGVSTSLRTGTGGATTVSGIGKAALVFDTTRESGTGWEKPQIVIDGQSGQCFDGVAPGSAISLAAGVLTLPAVYNAAAITYAIISLDGTETAVPDVNAEPLSGFAGKILGHAKLADSVAMSGACSYEYWGRPQSEVSSFYMPLLMFGNGADLATDGMNGGIYIASVDPDVNGWRAGVLRVIHSKYLAIARSAPHASINYYNLNTGAIIPFGEAIHVVVTHGGTGHWRVWLNGRLIKDYKVDLNQATYGNRTNGGEGIADIVSVNSHDAAGTLTRRTGEVFRVQQWSSKLTDAQAASLFSNAKNGTAFSGAAPANAWDFRVSLPSGTTNIVLGDRYTARTRFPALISGTNAATAATAAIQSNGNAIVTTNGGATNGRVYHPVLVGGTYTLVSKLDFGSATSIICRLSDTAGAAATQELWTITSAGGPIDRTDTFTPTGTNNSLHYVGVTATGGTFVVKAGTELFATAVP